VRNRIWQSVPFIAVVASVAFGIALGNSAWSDSPSAFDALSIVRWTADAPRVPVASALGAARIDGTIEGPEEGRTISGLKCLACRSKLECPHRGRRGRTNWRVEREETWIGPFTVRDSTGVLSAAPSGVMLVGEPDFVTDSSQHSGAGRCRTKDVVITDGQAVTVFGCMRDDGGGPRLAGCRGGPAVLTKDAEAARRILKGRALTLAYLAVIPLAPLVAWGFFATRRPDRSRFARPGGRGNG